MHREHANAGVNHVHAVGGQDVGDGATATGVNAAEFGGLEADVCVIHHAADEGNVLGVGIVGARLAAASRVLVEGEAAPKEARVLCLEDRGVAGVEGRGDVTREHARALEAAAQRQGSTLSGCLDKLGHDILKEAAAHRGSTAAANLLLVNKDGDGGALGRLARKLGKKRGVGAGAVVLAVAQDHRTVQAHVARLACGHNLKLGGEQVLLGDIVLLGENIKDGCLNRFFVLVLLGAVASCPGAVAHNHVEKLALNELGRLLLHLLTGKVGEKVGDAEDGVRGVLANHDLDDAPVLLGNNAMDCQGQGCPLVGLHAAVVVCVKRGDVVSLLERVLLDVQAGRVDVSTKDVDALLERLRAQLDEHEALAADRRVDLVAGRELLACLDLFLKRAIPMCLRKLDGSSAALSLGLVLRDELSVPLAEFRELRQVLLAIALPGVWSLHSCSFPKSSGKLRRRLYHPWNPRRSSCRSPDAT